jgi:hypothetical protein
MEKFEEQNVYFAEIGGSPEEILLLILQIPKIEQFEEHIFPFAETGGSPEDILQFGVQMKKCEKQMFFM